MDKSVSISKEQFTDCQKLLLQQVTQINEMVKAMTSMPFITNGNKMGKGGFKTKTVNRGKNFSKKEIDKMPRLADFTIRCRRIRNNNYYEARYRKYGFNVSLSSNDIRVVEEKAENWLTMFGEEIRRREQDKIYESLYKSREKYEQQYHYKKLKQHCSDMDFNFRNYNFPTNMQQNGFNNYFMPNNLMPNNMQMDMSRPTSIMFKAFADNYMFNVRKRKVKPITFNTYKNYYIADILPEYGNMSLDTISPMQIQSHLDRISKTKPRARACEDIKMLLNGIFDYAVANGIISRNPVKVIYVPKHERQNGVALTPQEEKAFIENIKGSRNEWLYLKMLYSGARPCEICTIEENIEKNTITIKNGKLKSYQRNYTREIPMTPKYKTTLGHPIRHLLCVTDLNADIKKYSPKHTLKDLRHTFTTRCRECGIDNELVAVWTGHSLGNITSSVYTHFSMEYQQKEALKIDYNL